MWWIDPLWKLLSNFSGLELLYFGCAVAGGFLFLIRLVLAFFGGDADDLEPGMEVGDDVDIIGDSDATFRVISLQGIVGFLLIFGLAGLTMSVQFKATYVPSVSVAFGAGAMTAIIIGWITFSLRKLDSPGTINMQNAVGQEGTIYLSIPEDGTGKARITIQNRLRVFDAVAEDKQPIPTESRIKVVGILAGNMLVVEKV